MSIDGLTSENCLFLICPTDCMEAILSENLKGQSFFYSALGACFKWDCTTQKSIVQLIEEQNIKQIAFVVKMNNTFFMDKIKVKYNMANYPIEKVLQNIEDSLPTQLHYWKTKTPKLMMLAVNYLEKQQNILLETPYLGGFIDNKKVSVVSLLYNEQNLEFLKTVSLKQRVKVFEKISMN